jgi:stearoyl-CoA desaturase (delta-9 desaturase)
VDAADPDFDRRLSFTAPGLWAMLSIHAAALLALHPAARPTSALLLFAALTFALRMFALTAGFHRYFSHRAFKTGRAFQFLLALVGGMSLQRGALWWAAHHRQHHTWSDRLGDPHSPQHGLWWSHMGWFMARGNQRTRTEAIPDFCGVPELVWLDRHEWVPLVLFAGLCLAAGAAWGAWHGEELGRAAFAWWVWGANVSTVCLCHAIFSINSVAHMVGTRRYDTADTSRNNPLVGLITFGEGWHNNHHRFPSRAHLGERLWEIDISWYGIRLLRALGVVDGARRRSARDASSEP